MDATAGIKPPRENSQETKIEEEENDSPIEQVRLTVPTTDDPSVPCLTFRVLTLGCLSCLLLSFVNQFFNYRTNHISISSVCLQILGLPMGRWMARVLPKKQFRVPLLNWSFSLNPGPFSMKEHVLLTIMGGSGANGNYATHIITIIKAFYHRGMNLRAALLLTQTTQLLGYGWAGIFRHFLVDSPYMWWPSCLINVSLFRALNEEEKRPKGGVTRLQFFLIVTACSFAYYIVPNFFFPAIGSLSFVCWIWKDSVLAHQLGSGRKGLGLGSIGLDWTVVTSFLGSPIAVPSFVLVNVFVGHIALAYIMVPLAYWSNAYKARSYPLLSSSVYDESGRVYNLTRVLDTATFSLDVQAYEDYSDIYTSIFFTFVYGIGFAMLTATFSHVFLFHGSYIIQLWRQATSNTQAKLLDVHGRIMKANYESVPQSWFYSILAVVTALSIFVCEGFDHQLQLPYWGVLLAIAMAFVFTLPIGIISATTTVTAGVNVITEMVIGYLMPGKPMANVVFKTYGAISLQQALHFLSDFKTGLYMKIPPKSMFIAQLAGTLIANAGYFGTTWYLLDSIPNICEPAKLPKGSPWTCPSDSVFYSASIIWGVVGPEKMFGTRSIYFSLNYFFILGLVAPAVVYAFHRLFPDKKWITLVNFPVIFGASLLMPPARAVNYNSWFIVGFIVNVWAFRRNKESWGRYAYVFSAAMDAGTSFLAVLNFFTLGNHGINSLNWWGGANDDFCPLAVCPTAPGAYAPPECPAVL